MSLRLRKGGRLKETCWDQFYLNSALFNLCECLEIKFPIIISSKAQVVVSKKKKKKTPNIKRDNVCIFVLVMWKLYFLIQKSDCMLHKSTARP